MTITISSSMKVIDEANTLADQLEELGNRVFRPMVGSARPKPENKRTYIHDHLDKLKRSDALFVANSKLTGDRFGRIGASTFFEIGWAYALAKKIIIYEPFDPDDPIAEDLLAIDPIVCNGDVTNLLGKESK